MIPLEVTAELAGAIALPGGPVALDALLAAAIAKRDNIPPATCEAEIVPIEIPVARSACGRFHLASFSDGAFESRDRRYINRRFPLPEAQIFGESKFKRIDISTGPAKSFRIPLETGHLEHDRLRWWCIGDRDAIAELLTTWIGYLGKKRSVGLGRVARWSVEPCEHWGDGFPVARDGLPLRTLPADWPGLSDTAERAYRVLTYPYWRHSAEQICAVPAWR